MHRHTLLLISLAALLMVCGLLSLLRWGPQDLSLRHDEHRHRFGAVYMTLNNPFYKIIDEEIRTCVENHGDVLLTRDPALSVERQTEAVRALIDEGVEVLFLTPVDYQQMGPALEAARAAGVPVIAIDTELADTAPVAATITSDNYQAGVACARHLLAHRQAARIVLLDHTATRSGSDRIRGFRDTIAAHPGFEILGEKECEGQLERAMPAMQHLLAQHPTLDTVMALNDPAALGALAALATAGRTDVSVYGVDGVPESKELILSGRMTATAGQSPRSIGRAAAQTAYALLAGSSYEAHQVLPITLFTQENLSAAQAKEWD